MHKKEQFSFLILYLSLQLTAQSVISTDGRRSYINFLYSDDAEVLFGFLIGSGDELDHILFVDDPDVGGLVHRIDVHETGKT